MSHADFLAIRDELTEKLANAIEVKLREMGDRAKGITWFSSIANKYTIEQATADI